MIGTGFVDRFLTPDETRDIVRAGLASLPLAGKRVLFIIPDGTRTMPMPELFRLFGEMLAGKVAALDYLVALGTHQPMSDAELTRLVGQPVVGGMAGASHVFNHEWADPATFAPIGEIPAAEIPALTGGRLAQSVPVSLNRRDLRLRPDRHLRAGVPARGRRLLGRQQVLLSRHRRAPRSSTSPTGWAR